MILDALVVGGGQAGLAAAYYLRESDLSYVLLDAHRRTGDSWRQRWEGLKLFSPQRYNALPGLSPPGNAWDLPSRTELADYLESYARTFAFPIEYGQEVVSVTRDGDFTVTTASGKVYRSRQLIVATGAYRTPFAPASLAAQFPPSVVQFHSSEIRTMDAVVDAGTSVLVIGAGASGQQLSKLALETGAAVILAGPKVNNLPRKFLGKDIYWWLYRAGLMSVRTDLPPASFFQSGAGGAVTVDEHEQELVGHPGLTREERYVTAYRGETLCFTDGKHKPDNRIWPGAKRGVVIWCTGFRNTYPWLPAEATDAEGCPLQRGGSSTTVPGLYFLGLPNLRHPNSSLVGGVSRDAAQIVERLKDATDAEQV